jgi:hypothetical protein
VCNGRFFFSHSCCEMPSIGAAPAYGDASSYSAEGFKSTKAERIESCHQSYLKGHSAARVPSTYISTSDKEALCLQYIDNFREQVEPPSLYLFNALQIWLVFFLADTRVYCLLSRCIAINSLWHCILTASSCS